MQVRPLQKWLSSHRMESFFTSSTLPTRDSLLTEYQATNRDKVRQLFVNPGFCSLIISQFPWDKKEHPGTFGDNLKYAAISLKPPCQRLEPGKVLLFILALAETIKMLGCGIIRDSDVGSLRIASMQPNGQIGSEIGQRRRADDLC